MRALFFLALILTSPTMIARHPVTFEVQGHRGARGLLPENTIPSFLKAIDLGVHTVEFDVVVSADRKIVVSHEPWFSHVICSTPDGRAISRNEEMNHLTYRLTYDEILEYDCGKRGNSQFPDQQPTPAAKPLMQDAIRAIEEYIAVHRLPEVQYNIETKSRREWDGKLTPPPDVFVQLLYDELEALDVLDRVTVQSFDVRTLQRMREIDETVSLALLVQNMLGLRANLRRLGFTPQIYSPDHRLVHRRLVEAVHQRGMRIIPWTVNEVPQMKRLRAMGVDGLITDYPDRAQFLLEE